jgi:hypothetical protein
MKLTFLGSLLMSMRTAITTSQILSITLTCLSKVSVILFLSIFLIFLLFFLIHSLEPEVTPVPCRSPEIVGHPSPSHPLFITEKLSNPTYHRRRLLPCPCISHEVVVYPPRFCLMAPSRFGNVCRLQNADCR